MSILSANTFYEYSNQIEGSFSGGTWVSSIGNVPHPVMTKQSDPLDPSSSGDTVIQMNAVALGGFNGLNN